MVSATASTYCKSAEPSSSGGCAYSDKLELAVVYAPSSGFVVNCRRPDWWFSLTSGSRPGS